MLQILPNLEFLAILIILLGILLIVVGCFLSSTRKPMNQSTQRREAKGVIFLGPIPIVWGFSKSTQIILLAAALTVFVLWLLWMQ
ncbi:MAG: DUF131 domain-containing protein [Candidatus Thorarchaeota archaeon]